MDNLSATLIHLLAVTASARLILTARSGEPVPDAVTSLWKDSLIARLDIGPFDRTQSTQLIETVLGGPLETASANRVYMMSRGNPLHMRHLVEGAVHAGSLREVDGVWQLRGEIALTPQLSDLISRHLSSMSTPVQGVLEYLSIEDPLTVSDLSAVAGRDAVEEAEAAGAVTVTARGHELVVHPAHPLYTEGLRRSMGRLAARRLRTKLVEQLSARDAAHVSDRLRLAALAVDSDKPPEVPDILGRSVGSDAAGRSRARGAACEGRIGEVIGSARPARPGAFPVVARPRP